ncbi:MAG: glycerol kinase [Omnitrophica bacterium RIFCSPHIGHO2_02_FULL_51_18]|nr:MAG: glycerol kinase [Omnitrophica bacterium RIFCSPHIGHO2_02_FULL_51_18]
MSKPYILALDLGTTGNRAIVFDKKLNVISREYEEFSQIYPKPGWVEHDPEEIWRSVQKILKKIFNKIPLEKIAALGVTNQRETIVLWDKKTGKPVHNAIVWQCRRTEPLCAKLRKKGLAPLIHKKTGLMLDPYFSASKINWLLQNVRGAKSKARQGKLSAGTIDSWIIYKLSDGALHVTDTSNASRTMLFNIHSRAWDGALCRIFGVPKRMLPRVVPSSAPAGMVSKRWFGSKIPITGIVGDQQAASFAQGVFSPGVIKNTYGTGLFALENTGKRPRFSENLLTTVAWSLGSVKKTEYAVEGSVFIAGAALQWLRDGLQLFARASETEKIAKAVKNSGDVYFVPALVGLGAPHWDANARGTIVGITRGTTRAHLVRAALEAIAYQTRDILEVMQQDTKARFKVLRVDGGASANNFLMQFQADILRIPVERPKVLETTALGAAGLAGLAVGFWKNRESFNRLRRVDRFFRPQMKKSAADRLYARWQKAVGRSLGWV